MKISIITVCYNSAATIQKTFDSVASQTYDNVEYIVVDGASTDGTLKIIEKNQEKITHFISEPDSGLYDAMNKGIALATGDLVGILNADDVFYSKQTLQEVADFHKEQDIDASVGNIEQYNAQGKLVRLYSAARWKPNKLKIGFMPPHPAVFFKRSLFQTLGMYPLDFTIGADYELMVRFFLKHTISWKYSGITTTKMLTGGLSSSGYQSYQLITKEIGIALQRNDIPYRSWKIHVRALWKIIGWIQRK